MLLLRFTLQEGYDSDSASSQKKKEKKMAEVEIRVSFAKSVIVTNVHFWNAGIVKAGPQGSLENRLSRIRCWGAVQVSSTSINFLNFCDQALMIESDRRYCNVKHLRYNHIHEIDSSKELWCMPRFAVSSMTKLSLSSAWTLFAPDPRKQSGNFEAVPTAGYGIRPCRWAAHLRAWNSNECRYCPELSFRF